ncbi:hypothetical protein ACH9EU_05855 [Kocuria sp. M1R5S2]|uniref:hypothetical protein n=1 Tax=Kocuria rhizosphaerae TaxID=3376285 RepID=UPI0037B5C6F3
MLVSTGTSSTTLAMFARLPPQLTDQGLPAADAGFALFVHSTTGLPLSVVVPLPVVRMRSPYPLGVVLAGRPRVAAPPRPRVPLGWDEPARRGDRCAGTPRASPPAAAPPSAEPPPAQTSQAPRKDPP